MPRRRVTIRQFGGALRRRVAEDKKAARAAALDTLNRVLAAAVRETNRQGLVDLHLYKNSWKVRPLPDGGEVVNDAPHASVIEYGRRPNRPGPPYAPIYEWVVRKLVGNGEVAPEDAASVAWAIRNAIHTRGSPPRHVLAHAMLHWRAWFTAELRRRLRR